MVKTPEQFLGPYFCTVPNLKGDSKYSERGPDFEQKGDPKGTKRGPTTRVVQKIENKLHVEISQKLNLYEDKNVFVFCFHLNKPILT